MSEAVGTRFSGLEWVDRLKGVAMLWVVLNHIVEQLVGGNYAGDPTGDWPPLAQRIAQFRPVHGNGLLDWPLTVVRDFGWLADQAVSLFIILSGFGLALGLLAKGAPASIALGSFYRRRLGRVYPMWWAAHILFVAIGGFLLTRTPTADWQFYASLLGLRFIPGVFSYPMSSWWYVGLIIQLYLIFPFMWRLLRARGPIVLIVLSSATAFVALGLGHAFLTADVVEMWQRGMCCATRLAEFAFGMALATWWAADRTRVETILRRPGVRAAVAAAYVAGIALTFTLPGMIVAPALLGASALVLLFPLMAWRATGHGALEIVGRHSFSIYLAHQFFINVFVRPDLRGAAMATGIGVALVFAAIGTIALERFTTAGEGAFASLRARTGARAAAGIAAAIAVCAFSIPVVADAALRNYARKEDTGSNASPILLEGNLGSHGSRYRAELFEGYVSDEPAGERAALAARFVRRFHFDVVLVQMAAGDVWERGAKPAPAASSSGAVSRAGDLGSAFALADLHRFVRRYVTRPLQAGLEGTQLFPKRTSRDAPLDRRGYALSSDARERAADGYRQIERAARSAGARTILVFVPAAPQVCERTSLAADASNRALEGRPRYGMPLSEADAQAIAGSAALTLWDLGAAVRALQECPYAPDGRRLTPAGRNALAEIVSERLRTYAARTSAPERER